MNYVNINYVNVSKFPILFKNTSKYKFEISLKILKKMLFHNIFNLVYCIIF